MSDVQTTVERHQLTLVFRKPAAEKLREMRRAAGDVSNGQLIAAALELYDWLQASVDRGMQIWRFNAEEGRLVEIELGDAKKAASSDVVSSISECVENETDNEEVCLDFSEQSYQWAEDLRERLGVATKAAVVRDALRVLDYYMTQVRDGFQLGMTADEGDNVEVPQLKRITIASAPSA